MYNKAERIGTMRHRIRFVRGIKGRDAYGGETRTWITSDYVWANVEYQESGSDMSEEASRLQAFTKAIVTTRFASTVWAGMRIKFDSREFRIESVLPDAKRQYMKMEAVIDGPREQEYVTASGQPWELPGGGAWLVAEDGDKVTEATADTTYTDSAGLTWNVDSSEAGQADEDGNPVTSHGAGDVKEEPGGLSEWTDDEGITWNPS